MLFSHSSSASSFPLSGTHLLHILLYWSIPPPLLFLPLLCSASILLFLFYITAAPLFPAPVLLIPSSSAPPLLFCFFLSVSPLLLMHLFYCFSTTADAFLSFPLLLIPLCCSPSTVTSSFQYLIFSSSISTLLPFYTPSLLPLLPLIHHFPFSSPPHPVLLRLFCASLDPPSSSSAYYVKLYICGDSRGSPF